MTNSEIARGSCLCGQVAYEISGNLGIFQYCHCSRCRKFTGSAFASNILIAKEHFRWTAGALLVQCFEPKETKHFATAFCKKCGSSLPWLGKTKKAIVIPAGTLDTDPSIRPMQNIFWKSKALWHKDASELLKHDELPTK
jgi:hypothetical protein